MWEWEGILGAEKGTPSVIMLINNILFVILLSYRIRYALEEECRMSSLFVLKEMLQSDFRVWSSFTEHKPFRFIWIINTDPIEGVRGRPVDCYWVSVPVSVPSHSLPLGQWVFLSTWLAGWAHMIATELAQSEQAKSPFCESLGRIPALEDALMGDCVWKNVI